MRIWSKNLIEFLPNKQLKSMRYELGDMIQQYPNIRNPLVRFANNYDIAYLGQYYGRVLREFQKRNINHNITYDGKNLSKIDELTKFSYQYIIENDLTFEEDNEEYLKICLWNLYEKSIRGSIKYNEWLALKDIFIKECLNEKS